MRALDAGGHPSLRTKLVRPWRCPSRHHGRPSPTDMTWQASAIHTEPAQLTRGARRRTCCECRLNGRRQNVQPLGRRNGCDGWMLSQRPHQGLVAEKRGADDEHRTGRSTVVTHSNALSRRGEARVAESLDRLADAAVPSKCLLRALRDQIATEERKGPTGRSKGLTGRLQVGSLQCLLCRRRRPPLPWHHRVMFRRAGCRPASP